MRSSAIALCLCALAFSACTTVEKPGVPIRQVNSPEWVKTGRHPEFPDTTHLTAYAAGDSPATAQVSADERLALTITGHALDLSGEKLANTQLAKMLTGPCAWLNLAELGDSVKREAASDGFQSCAVTAIPRGELKYRALQLLPAARQKLAADVAPPELDDACNRVKAWAARFLTAARVLALALLAKEEIDGDAFQTAELAALSLADVSSQMVVAQQGEGQQAKLLGGITEDLGLTASFRNRMPAGLKLAWSIEAPAGGLVSGFNEFNATGQAFCKVYAIASYGNDNAYVRAAIDLDGMTGVRLGLEMPPWRWRVIVPSRSQVALEIDVQEQFGAAAAEPAFTPAFVEWARLNELSLKAEQGPIPNKRLVYGVKLAGLIRVTVIKQGERLLGRAEGQVTLTDTAGGNVIFRHSPSALLEADKDSSTSELAKLTLREAAADTLLEFGARLLALFPEPAQ